MYVVRFVRYVTLIKSGDDIKTVQENLGHAAAAFTLDVYGHVTKQMNQERFECLRDNKAKRRFKAIITTSKLVVWSAPKRGYYDRSP